MRISRLGLSILLSINFMVCSVFADVPPAPLKVCSFNIKFLGHLKNKDNYSLADYLSLQDCDLLFIQELAAPPAHPNLTQFPDGNAISPDAEATAFFLAMKDKGFDDFWISEQDTGSMAKNQINSSATEWFVVFYNRHRVTPNLNLPHGFIADDVTAHGVYKRVPYAFSFSWKAGNSDFVFVNTHLTPESHEWDLRQLEIQEMYDWVDKQKKRHPERDYVLLGDFNIDDPEELAKLPASEFVSLNTDGKFSTQTRGPKPYDHFFVPKSKRTNSEIPIKNNFLVGNLVQEMKDYWYAWTSSLAGSIGMQYPGEPYDIFAFPTLYSDHELISFEIEPQRRDDDGNQAFGKTTKAEYALDHQTTDVSEDLL